MTVIMGIDLGSKTGLAIIAENQLVDTALYVDKTVIKRKTKKSDISRIVGGKLQRLEKFLSGALTAYLPDVVVIEAIPSLRNLEVFQQLSMMFGVAILVTTKKQLKMFTYPVADWRKIIGVDVSLPKGLPTGVRSKTMKNRVISTVNGILGSDIRDDNRADAAGLAIAGAVTVGTMCLERTT